MEMDGEDGASSQGESTSISGDSVSLSWIDGVLESLPLLFETKLNIFILTRITIKSSHCQFSFQLLPQQLQ